MNDSSRTQGGLICVGVVVVAAVFLLGLTFWVGYTIATIQVEPEDLPTPDAEPAPDAQRETSG